MAITLSDTRITVAKDADKGTSWENPFTIEDLYDAAISNGWNITKLGRGTYVIDGYSIWLTSDTFMKFLNCTLIFQGIIKDTYVLYPRNIQFGEYDETTQKTSLGCEVILNYNSAKFVRITNLYDTSIAGKNTGDYSTYSFNELLVYGKIRNSKISNGATQILFGVKLDIKNTIITNCYYGMRSPLSGSNFENVVFNNCEIGVWLYRSTNNVLKNIDARGNNIVDILNQTYLDENQENTLVGCIFDSYNNKFPKQGSEKKDSYCILNIAEFFNLKVVDSEGIPIEGASVALFSADGQIVFEVVTDSEGNIEEKIVTRIRDEIWKRAENNYYPARTIYRYNPFKLIVEHPGKQKYETIITINESRKLDIALLDIPPSVFINRKIKGSLAIRQTKGNVSVQKITGRVNRV